MVVIEGIEQWVKELLTELDAEEVLGKWQCTIGKMAVSGKEQNKEEWLF